MCDSVRKVKNKKKKAFKEPFGGTSKKSQIGIHVRDTTFGKEQL